MSYNFINTLKNTPIEEIQIGNHDNLVCCNISEYTDRRRRHNSRVNRNKILKTLKNNNINNKIFEDTNDYFKNLVNYKFTISPEGNVLIAIDIMNH